MCNWQFLSNAFVLCSDTVYWGQSDKIYTLLFSHQYLQYRRQVVTGLFRMRSIWKTIISIIWWYQNLHIPCKIDTSHRGVYLDYWGPCPVHPTCTHTWGDCFNNPKNNNTSDRNFNNRNRGGRTGRGSYYYNQGGRRFGQGYVLSKRWTGARGEGEKQA